MCRNIILKLKFVLAAGVIWWRPGRWTGQWVKLLLLDPFSKRESMSGSRDRFGLLRISNAHVS